MPSGVDQVRLRARANRPSSRLPRCVAALCLLMSPAAAEDRLNPNAAEAHARRGSSATPDRAALVMNGVISTARWSEVRVTISPDGTRRLWGVIRNDIAPGKLTIVESVHENGEWSAAQAAAFGSDANDFDPFFAPDGRSVLFFSSREGGFGQDDLWSVPFNPATGRYGTPHNLGPHINTPANEWAPSLSGDGKILLFSSDGRGGMGGHDLFMSRQGRGGRWSAPVNLGPVLNTERDEFDAVFAGKRLLVFASGDSKSGPVRLYAARAVRSGFEAPVALPLPFNCSDTFNLGPFWHRSEPGWLYFSARCLPTGHGNMDVFKALLR